ncbi:hypothetical protein D3C81_2191810 [compost metagenome]
MHQRDIGHTSTVVHICQLLKKRMCLATKASQEAKAPRLGGHLPDELMIPLMVRLAQRPNQHGSAVIQRFNPVFLT